MKAFNFYIQVWKTFLTSQINIDDVQSQVINLLSEKDKDLLKKNFDCLGEEGMRDVSISALKKFSSNQQIEMLKKISLDNFELRAVFEEAIN